MQSPRCSGKTDLVRGSAGVSIAGVPWALAFAHPGRDMTKLTTVQLPIQFPDFGLPARLQTRTTCLRNGDPGWAWDGDRPDLGIAQVASEAGTEAEGWDLDHVVLLVPDLDATVAELDRTLGSPRLRTTVETRPTAFYRVGPLLEVIESPVRAASLFGIALVTDRALDEVVRDWRERGATVTDPQPAIQPGRVIFTVKGTNAGFAVMSPDGPV